MLPETKATLVTRAMLAPTYTSAGDHNMNTENIRVLTELLRELEPCATIISGWFCSVIWADHLVAGADENQPPCPMT